MFKCKKCGMVWEWAEADGSPDYCDRDDFGFVHCGCGGSVYPAERCNCCGKMCFTDEDDAVEQELYNGYCLDCIKKSISIEVAREYFEAEKCMTDFMTEYVWECGQPVRITKIFEAAALRDFEFLSKYSPMLLREKCVEWIVNDYDWIENYVEFAKSKGVLK